MKIRVETESGWSAYECDVWYLGAREAGDVMLQNTEVTERDTHTMAGHWWNRRIEKGTIRDTKYTDVAYIRNILSYEIVSREAK